MYGDYIAYDFWLGKVYDLTNHIILKLSNGARYKICPSMSVNSKRFNLHLSASCLASTSLYYCRCSMNVEDGAKLYDVCPHVSDSVGEMPRAVFFLCENVAICPRPLHFTDLIRLARWKQYEMNLLLTALSFLFLLIDHR